MPRIHSFGHFNAYIYADDHNPPHFHVVGKGWSAMVDIRNLQLVAGRMPARNWPTVIRWATGNRALLLSKWNELNERD